MLDWKEEVSNWPYNFIGSPSQMAHLMSSGPLYELEAFCNDYARKFLQLFIDP